MLTEQQGNLISSVPEKSKRILKTLLWEGYKRALKRVLYETVAEKENLLITWQNIVWGQVDSSGTILTSWTELPF